MVYIYESHKGGLFYEEDSLGYEDTYCETCGDSDYCLGFVCSKEEAWELLEDETDREIVENGETYNTGGYDRSYVEEFIDSIPFGE